MTSIHTKVYKNLDKIFISQWENMWEKSPHGHFFNSPKWFQICVETFNIKTFRIFATYQHGELKAVLPLVKSKKFGISVFTSPGGRFLEKSNLLMSEKNTFLINSLFTEIEKHGNLFLSEINTKLANHLEKIKPKSLISTISINPFIDLTEDPCRYLVKKQKNRILNRMKRFKPRLKHGHYTNNLSDHLKTIFEVEQKSTKSKNGKDLFSNTEARNLYQNILSIAPENVLIDILYYQEKPVVTMFGIIWKDKYLGFHTSYVAEFKNLLPGKILLHKMIYKLYRGGFKWFDFSRGHNALKKEFTPNFELQYDVYASSNILVRFWWQEINRLRKIKAWLTKQKYSLDGDYLFKKFQSVRYSETRFIHALN